MTQNARVSPIIQELTQQILFLSYKEANEILKPYGLVASISDDWRTLISTLEGEPVAFINGFGVAEPVVNTVDDTQIGAVDAEAFGIRQEYKPKEYYSVDEAVAGLVESFKKATATVEASSDARTVNSTDANGNVMRHSYRVLTELEKIAMQAVKDKGLEFYNLIASLGEGRELSIAKTKIEEAVMWGTKFLTK